MLYRIKPQIRPAIKPLNKVWVKKPQSLLRLLYGFNGFRYALESLHPEGTNHLLQGYLDELIEKTDNDILYCPEDIPFESLEEQGALHYFLAIEQEATGSSQLRKIPNHKKTYAFITFSHQDTDHSLQLSPLAHFIHSSCQAFFDYDSGEFIFKNEACYQAFQKRLILTPGLKDLITQSQHEIDKRRLDPKQKLLTFKTLTFIIRHHLKMRLIGWTLSDEDRKNLRDLIANHKDLAHHLETALLNNMSRYPFINILLHEFACRTLTIDLLLKKRDIENKQYLVFDKKRSLKEHAESIAWLFKQKLCPLDEKISTADHYCESLNHHDVDIDSFIETLNDINPTIAPQIPLLKSFQNRIPSSDRASTKSSSASSSKTVTFMNAKKNEPKETTLVHEYNFTTKPRVSENNLRTQAIRLLQDIKKDASIYDVFNYSERDLIADDYMGSVFRIRYLAPMILSYTLACMYFLTPDDREPTMPELVSVLFVLASLSKFTDGSLMRYYLHQHINTNKKFLIASVLSVFSSELRSSQNSKNMTKSHAYGIFSLSLLLDHNTNKYALEILEHYQESHHRHPALKMIIYVSMVLYNTCHFDRIKFSDQTFMDLMVEICDHFKLKSLDAFWGHMPEIKNLPTEAMIIQKSHHAFEKIVEHAENGRPFNDTLCTYLNDFALGIPYHTDTEKYDEKLPSMFEFIRNSEEKATQNNDAATLFLIYRDPIKLLSKNDEAKDNLKRDLTKISRKTPKPV